MVTIGTGPGDPRARVRAAYTLIEAAETAAPGDKLPAQARITAELGISPATARRACRELARLGLYPNPDVLLTALSGPCLPARARDRIGHIPCVRGHAGATSCCGAWAVLPQSAGTRAAPRCRPVRGQRP
jgi:Bacterial regulatory proteins, gntR family